MTLSRLQDFFTTDPLMACAITAALFAFATTPIAFAVLGRLDWFKARRGRVLMRPAFSSIVCGMMLVMGIPAIFLALVVKSQYYDKNRYEFDPNKTWSVIEQGRGYKTLKALDDGLTLEQKRLGEMRKNLVDHVKKVDESMLALRAVAGTSPAVAQAMPAVLQRLAKLHESIGLDGPHQLMDLTAPPVELAAVPTAAAVPAAPAPAAVAVAAPQPALAVGEGLTKAQADAELATVPQEQKALAAMLPLADLPAGWTVGKSGDKHLETFNAENLFEKIDGRAESFIQYDVKGMAYANYHPSGDESNELQLYIFEMADALKAFGKYGSEKPEEAKALPIGAEGYTASGSTLFYSGKYYTQIVSTTDDPKFSAFAQELAKRVAEAQKPAGGTPAPGEPAKTKSTPESLFGLLPAVSSKSSPKYAAQDVFGYSFLSDVFMADYQENDGKVTWQGFIRPYANAEEARKVFDTYLESAKRDGAKINEIQSEGAERMIVSDNIGLVDVIFLKGNVLGGANGATEAKAAETFARAFVKALPATVPALESSK